MRNESVMKAEQGSPITIYRILELGVKGRTEMLTSTHQGRKTTLYLVPSQETEVVFERSSRASVTNQFATVKPRNTIAKPPVYQRVVGWLSQRLKSKTHSDPADTRQSWQQLQELEVEHAPVLGRSHEARSVRGIADRMPRLVDENYPFPARDTVFLGEARDYPDKVLALQYGEHLKAVQMEGTQLVARGLFLDTTQPMIEGKLILNDGSTLPVHIQVIIAV